MTDNEPRLKDLSIRRPYTYEEGKGTGYVGSVTFTSNLGEVKLNLDERLSERILNVVADELVAASRNVASTLTAKIIESAANVSSIEDKTNDR